MKWDFLTNINAGFDLHVQRIAEWPRNDPRRGSISLIKLVVKNHQKENSMKHSLLFLLVAVSLFGCKDLKYNREAIRLNDTAVNREMSAMGNHYSALKNAIVLLDSATKIDSNYIIAYNNKFNFQMQLGRYKDAVRTGKQILRLEPNDFAYKIYIGIAFEKTNDTVTAKRLYSEGLVFCTKILDTMSVHHKSYEFFTHQKAMYLILLHQEQKAYDLLKSIYENEKNPWLTDADKDDMCITRDKLINGTTIDTTKREFTDKENKEFEQQIKKSFQTPSKEGH
ncbi:MAG: tetratricopeptide repeat protein [Mucilaginibacter sp.]